MTWNTSDRGQLRRRRARARHCVLALALAIPAAAQQPQTPASAPATDSTTDASLPLTLEQALRLALERSPDLAAGRSAAAAAEAGIGVARQRPNPDLTVEAEKETPRQSATLAFPLEPGGKRPRRIELAEAAARTATADLASKQMEVRANVRRAFYDYAAALRRAALRREQMDLVVRLRDAAQARFDSGEAPRLELVQAELAVAQTQTDADNAEGVAAAARASLAALLNWTDPETLTIRDELELGVLPDAATLVARALDASAELHGLERQVEEQTSRLALARALQVPDLTVEGAVAHDSLPEFLWGWRAALSVTLPLFHHHGAEVEVEQHVLEQRAAELDAARRRVSGEVNRQHALAAAAQRSALRYRDQVVPRAEEVERMAEDSYRSGQTDLVELITALRAARETRLQSIQAGIDYQTAVVDLEQAMGTPLP